MKCIFCKSQSDSSKSVEHIIPESLGNTQHTLPRGVVCDKCNNYFSRKIEQPLLQSDYFIQARFRNQIGNKKGRIPTLKTVHLKSKTIIELDSNDGTLYPTKENDFEKFLTSLLESEKIDLIFPVATEVDKYLMSRFLGKMAVEASAQRILSATGSVDLVINEPGLNTLRDYVRFGNKKVLWPYYEREIYPENKIFQKGNEEPFEILHEFQFLYTSSQELHFVIAIFGVEYTINMESPSTVSYQEWIKNNSNKSPLYMNDEDLS